MCRPKKASAFGISHWFSISISSFGVPSNRTSAPHGPRLVGDKLRSVGGCNDGLGVIGSKYGQCKPHVMVEFGGVFSKLTLAASFFCLAHGLCELGGWLY
jgi:hypothetical protein